MHTSDFDYELPEELIAQEPVEPRDAARLLVLDRRTDSLKQRRVGDLPELLEPGDLLVANRSRVLPARVIGRRAGGGRAELLLLRKLAPGHWLTLARPARRLRVGDVVSVGDDIQLTVTSTQPDGIREVRVLVLARSSGTTPVHSELPFDPDSVLDQADPDASDPEHVDPDAVLLAIGKMPLPPYIHGWIGDAERYQTIFADADGSAAAPTAGLHFTQDLLDRLAERDVCFEKLVLHVGLDTFRPIAQDDPLAHRMHREWYSVPPSVQQLVQRTRARGARVIAVGTTTVRALEAWAATGQPEGWTDLFIVPGHRFVVVDCLLTNFHLPRSTLLMLVSAFAGRERVLAAYAEATRQGYRFYSFGDAMLIR